MIHPRWSPEKVERFVKDWNDGMSRECLSEKYAVRKPAPMAAALRKRGLPVQPRKPVRQPIP